MKDEKKTGDGEGRAILSILMMDGELWPIRNWCEWLVLWQKAKTFEEKISLLHCGFAVSLEQYMFDEKKYDEGDRLIFYLNIADGWTDNYFFRFPEDKNGDKKYEFGFNADGSPVKKTISELRQVVARKAFDMLCANYFSKVILTINGRHGSEFHWDWEKFITSEKFFSVIRNFFRVQKMGLREDVEIRNLSYQNEKRSHNEKQAVDFLLNLARFMWGWKEIGDGYYSAGEKVKREEYASAVRGRIDAAKPWMVEVLSELGQLKILEKRILTIDKSCFAKLKEIALRSRLERSFHPVTENRLVNTLDEACYLGSEAAWFLKKYELIQREHARLTDICETEQAIVEASCRIEKLKNQS